MVDDEVTLFDTVEEEFTEELLERVESVLQGREIDNIVVQHTEPDHSGGFKSICQISKCESLCIYFRKEKHD